MQAEAAALNVPVRFLHELRTLLPQVVETADTTNEEDAGSDPAMDSAGSPQVFSDSAEVGKGYMETSELQTALMAAPQMAAAISGMLQGVMPPTRTLSVAPACGHTCMQYCVAPHSRRHPCLSLWRFLMQWTTYCVDQFVEEHKYIQVNHEYSAAFRSNPEAVMPCDVHHAYMSRSA